MCSRTIPVLLLDKEPAIIPVHGLDNARPDLAAVNWSRLQPAVARAAAELAGHPDAATLADIVNTLVISPDLLPNFEAVLPALGERLHIHAMGLDAEGGLYYGKAMRSTDARWHNFALAQYKVNKTRAIAAELLSAVAYGDEQRVLVGD